MSKKALIVEIGFTAAGHEFRPGDELPVRNRQEEEHFMASGFCRRKVAADEPAEEAEALDPSGRQPPGGE